MSAGWSRPEHEPLVHDAVRDEPAHVVVEHPDAADVRLGLLRQVPVSVVVVAGAN
jgi:hypothetical protein